MKVSVPQASIGWEAAAAAVAAAVSHAQRAGIRINVAVVDAGGRGWCVSAAACRCGTKGS
jgi:uncharacterized protein GlcG (DUF336 family)